MMRSLTIHLVNLYFIMSLITKASASTVTTTTAEKQKFPLCNICGPWSYPSSFTSQTMVDLEFFGRSKVSCSLLEKAGMIGDIAPEMCTQLPNIVKGPCDCQEAVAGVNIEPAVASGPKHVSAAGISTETISPSV